jgi:ribonuclease HII
MQVSKFHIGIIIQSMKFAEKLIVGIDEAGRGPLAGPITLSAFLASQNLKSKLIKILGGKIKDSKQFLPKRRYEIYKEFKKLKSQELINFSVSHVSNEIIDKKGISYATNLAIKRVVKFFDKNCAVRLDGSLKAPTEFKNQKTIIGGDSKDIFIACASIVAKVRRDRLMRRLGSKYPCYELQIHKGYGTKLHYKLLKKHGLSKIHRKSFCKNLTVFPK